MIWIRHATNILNPNLLGRGTWILNHKFGFDGRSEKPLIKEPLAVGKRLHRQRVEDPNLAGEKPLTRILDSEPQVIQDFSYKYDITGDGAGTCTGRRRREHLSECLLIGWHDGKNEPLLVGHGILTRPETSWGSGCGSCKRVDES